MSQISRYARFLLFVPAILLITAGLLMMFGAPAQPAQAIESAQSADCGTCHYQIKAHWESSLHGEKVIECIACHRLLPGEGVHPQVSFSVEKEETTCEVCHAQITNEWKSSRHGEINLTCVTCHEPHSQEQRVLEGFTTTCEGCHRAQLDIMHQSTHSLAGLDCVTCHLGPEHGHGFAVKGSTCGSCHTDIHEANRLVTAGVKIQTAVDADGNILAPAPTSMPAPVQTQTDAPGINLPPWTLLLAGFLLGGLAVWVFIGKDPGTPTEGE
jgi:hypothetical protein